VPGSAVPACAWFLCRRKSPPLLSPS